jgi:hypothetical protein
MLDMHFIWGLRFSIRFMFRRSKEQKTCHFQAFKTKVLGVGNLNAWCSAMLGTLLS